MHWLWLIGDSMTSYTYMAILNMVFLIKSHCQGLYLGMTIWPTDDDAMSATYHYL